MNGAKRVKILNNVKKYLSLLPAYPIEFWPTWLLYLPLLPGWIYWSIRYKGFHSIALANPGMFLGDAISCSKAEILSQLPQKWVADWVHIPSNKELAKQVSCSDILKARLDILERKAFLEKKWNYPIILKPDYGHKGVGVRLIQNLQDAQNYLKDFTHAVIAQVYCAPSLEHEAGIMYYRLPDDTKGKIFSITNKELPVLTGNGKDSLSTLIAKHPRYRFQSKRFLKNLKERNYEAQRIPAKNEATRLSIQGNHTQGTCLKNIWSICSAPLEARIDEISQHFDGFYFGRFDILYKSQERLRQGLDFKIIELNGASSVSINIYDPKISIWKLYRTLYTHWDILFRIAHINRKNGVRAVTLKQFLKFTIKHYKSQWSKGALANIFSTFSQT